MEGTNGIGLGDAMLLANQGKDGWGGGCFFWVIILFWLMAGGNGWGNNNRNYATTNDVYAANDQQSLMNNIEQVRAGNINLGNGLADLGYALNNSIQNGFTGVMRDTFSLQNTMMGGFNNIGQAINENRFATQQGFCNTNYNNAMNTCSIKENATANTQAILDKLNAMQMDAKTAEIANLRQALADSQLAYSQQAQNATLISALKPYPSPAYLVGNPYGNTCACGVQ